MLRAKKKTHVDEEDVHLLLIKLNYKKLIAGIDEVGKGCLFGPVFAGAVILNPRNKEFLIQEGVKDSKKLSAKKRGILVPKIKQLSIAWSLGQASAREIDHLGIRTATEKAMIRAVEGLKITPESLVVDGSLPLRLWKGKQMHLIKGEDAYLEIAAASILAKETRDSLMKRLAISFPNYGIERHVGYGTKFHRQALSKLGATKLHRISFLKNLYKQF